MAVIIMIYSLANEASHTIKPLESLKICVSHLTNSFSRKTRYFSPGPKRGGRVTSIPPASLAGHSYTWVRARNLLESTPNRASSGSGLLDGLSTASSKPHRNVKNVLLIVRFLISRARLGTSVSHQSRISEN